jgi:hypothetical protein
MPWCLSRLGISGVATCHCSRWSVTLFRDNQTAVDAGNVLMGKNFIGGNVNFFVGKCFALLHLVFSSAALLQTLGLRNLFFCQLPDRPETRLEWDVLPNSYKFSFLQE